MAYGEPTDMCAAVMPMTLHLRSHDYPVIAGIRRALIARCAELVPMLRASREHASALHAMALADKLAAASAAEIVAIAPQARVLLDQAARVLVTTVGRA